MAPGKRVDIGAIAAAYDKQRASLNAKTTIEGARAECLKAIRMLQKANEGAKLSEEYLKNSTTLMVEEVREIRKQFDEAFKKDYMEMEKISVFFKKEATPIVNDIARLHEEIRQKNTDLKALQNASKKFVENTDEMKQLLLKKYASQKESNEYYDKLKELEKTSLELTKSRFSQTVVQPRKMTAQYYGTAEGSVLIPKAVVSIVTLQRELNQLCDILGTEGLGQLEQFRTLTSQLRGAFLAQVDINKNAQESEVCVAVSTDTDSSLPVSTSQLRVPFIDELSTILYEPSVSLADLTTSESDASFSDFELHSSASEYLTSVES